MSAAETDPSRDVLGDAPRVDDVVAALREDPVLVHPTFGNGARDAVDAAITAKVAEAREAGTTVYVALVPHVQDLAGGDYGQDAADELAILLGDRLGGDAFLFTAVDPYSLYAAELGTGDLESARVDYVPGQSEGTQSALVGQVAWGVDQLAGNGENPGQYVEGIWEKPEWQWDRDGSTDAFLSTFAPTTALVLVAVVVTLAIRAVGRPPRLVEPVRSRPTTVRLSKDRPTGGERVRAADQDLGTLARTEVEEVERLRSRRARRSVDSTARERIDGSYAAAQAILDTGARGRRREPDLLGALVLARVARAALDDPRSVYRPCYVNPTHGAATEERTVQDGGVRVPVCRACARGSITDPYLVRRGLRRAPYYAGDDVWARTGYGSLVDDLWSEVVRDRRRRAGDVS